MNKIRNLIKINEFLRNILDNWKRKGNFSVEFFTSHYSGGLSSGETRSSPVKRRLRAFSSTLICRFFNIRNEFNLSSSRLTIESNDGILVSLNNRKTKSVKHRSEIHWRNETCEISIHLRKMRKTESWTRFSFRFFIPKSNFLPFHLISFHCVNQWRFFSIFFREKTIRNRRSSSKFIGQLICSTFQRIVTKI